MSGVSDRIVNAEGGPITRRGSVPVSEVIARLRAGEAPAGVMEHLGLDLGEFVAALAFEGLGPEGSAGVGLIQGPPRHPWIREALEEPAWSALLPRSPRPGRLALAAGLLQAHDHWDASHEAAQQADDLGERSVAAYWHGIAHRREPDSGNASYWFRRVGRHALLAPLGEQARRLTAAEGHSSLGDRLAPGSVWNPFAFIDYCADGRPADGDGSLARKLQRLEMVMLLDATAAAAGVP